MYLLLNKITPLIGGFSEELTKEQRDFYTCLELDIEACVDACKLVVESQGNSYMVDDVSKIESLYRVGVNRLFFRYDNAKKVIRQVKLSDEANTKAIATASQEIVELKKTLSSTDWAVVKCMELGVSLKGNYPDIANAREAARADINAKEAEVSKLRASQPKIIEL